MSEHTYLYRFYDQWFSLLYVGITSGVPTRFEDHAKSKDWWPDVRHIDIERYDDRTTAAEAERQAIRKEGPRYNVQHGTAEARPNRGAVRGGITIPPARLVYLIEAWALSYSSVGRMFGVSRQAVSKWVANGYPSARIVDVDDLALPTELLATRVGFDYIPTLVRRIITTQGDSILSVAESGDLPRTKAMLNMHLMRAA